MGSLTMPLSEEVAHAIRKLDFAQTQRTYWEQNECVFLTPFLPPEVVETRFLPEVERLRAEVHRNYIPRHKKGGSISYYTLAEKTPVFVDLYHSPASIDFISRLVGSTVLACPEDDPHACALYFYTEPGDHIGFHYDTSHYKGARYTILMGLVQRSTQCRLVCQLHNGDPTRQMHELRLATPAGAMVIFNGNKLWHAITPLEEGAERIVLTMEYVTNPAMGPFHRFVSNMKDAIAYFGFSAVLRGALSRRRVRTPPHTSRPPGPF
jgi:alkylated DNA repair dioxygenase AlkB